MSIFDIFRKAYKAALPERTVDDLTLQGLADMPEGALRILIDRATADQLVVLIPKLRAAEKNERALCIADKGNKDLHLANVVKLAEGARRATQEWAARKQVERAAA